MEAELTNVEFRTFPKLPRLKRDMVITEKIDGTNGCIVIELAETVVTNPQEPESPHWNLPIAKPVVDGVEYAMYAQSRKRMIKPGKATDNQGFAAWVAEEAEHLVRLGVGRHFGEWWGQGIQRSYGLEEKRFSLFNVGRDMYRELIAGNLLPGNVGLVPVLDRYSFDTGRIDQVFLELQEDGSRAAPGFANPEGIVVYHTHGRQSFKMTYEYDAKGKDGGSA